MMLLRHVYIYLRDIYQIDFLPDKAIDLMDEAGAKLSLIMLNLPEKDIIFRKN